MTLRNAGRTRAVRGPSWRRSARWTGVRLDGWPGAEVGLKSNPRPPRGPALAKKRPGRSEVAMRGFALQRTAKPAGRNPCWSPPRGGGRVPRLQTALRQIGRDEEAELCEAAARQGAGERHVQRLPGPRRRVNLTETQAAPGHIALCETDERTSLQYNMQYSASHPPWVSICRPRSGMPSPVTPRTTTIGTWPETHHYSMNCSRRA